MASRPTPRSRRCASNGVTRPTPRRTRRLAGEGRQALRPLGRFRRAIRRGGRLGGYYGGRHCASLPSRRAFHHSPEVSGRRVLGGVLGAGRLGDREHRRLGAQGRPARPDVAWDRMDALPCFSSTLVRRTLSISVICDPIRPPDTARRHGSGAMRCCTAECCCVCQPGPLGWCKEISLTLGRSGLIGIVGRPWRERLQARRRHQHGFRKGLGAEPLHDVGAVDLDRARADAGRERKRGLMAALRG